MLDVRCNFAAKPLLRLVSRVLLCFSQFCARLHADRCSLAHTRTSTTFVTIPDDPVAFNLNSLGNRVLTVAGSFLLPRPFIKSKLLPSRERHVREMNNASCPEPKLSTHVQGCQRMCTCRRARARLSNSIANEHARRAHCLSSEAF